MGLDAFFSCKNRLFLEPSTIILLFLVILAAVWTSINFRIGAIITLHLGVFKHMPCFKLCMKSCINLSGCTHLERVHHPGTLTLSAAIHFSWSPAGDGACPQVGPGNYCETFRHFVARILRSTEELM